MTNENPIVPAGEGAGSERREAVREKAQKVKARQRRAKILRRGGVALLILAAVAAIVYGVVSVVAPTVSKPMLTPENMDGDAIVVEEGDDLVAMGGLAEAEQEDQEPRASAVDIRVYIDYMSDGSAQFEQENSAQLAKWVGQGAADLSYHPVSLLTAKSNGTKYSVRAAGAVACVRTHAPETAIAFNHQLLIDQPRLDDDGYSNGELAEQAIALGVANTQDVRDCIENEDFAPWAADATQRALEQPLPGTDGVELTGAPIILVNGQAYTGSLTDPAEFAQFVLTVSSDAYYSTPAPGATPEETAEPEATEEPAPDETEEPAPEDEPAPEETPAPEEEAPAE